MPHVSQYGPMLTYYGELYSCLVTSNPSRFGKCAISGVIACVFNVVQYLNF